MLNGSDLDEDGRTEALPGESGAQMAYEQAYRMADMPLAAVGIQNLGTGTPTFILIPATNLSGGGGIGGPSVTAGPTLHIPPGQQRTPGRERTPRPPKTKEPKDENNNNNGNGNGNNN